MPAGGRLAPGFPWPRPAELLSVREPWLIPAVILVATRLVLALQIPFASEDAYITFRFASNFAHGHGLVFNPDQRVFGFSSPLWTLWIAAGIKLGLNPVLWARGTSLAMELAALVAVAAMLRDRVSRGAAWCFTFFWAAWPYLAAVSNSGMENSAMVGLLALATAWCAGRSPLAGPGLAGLVLIRPEGVFCAIVIATLASWRDRAIAVVLAGGAIGGLALYYGSPIPQSVIAKAHTYGLTGPWAGRYWWDWITPVVFGRFTAVIETRHLFMFSLVLGPAAVLGARTLWAERRSPIAAFTGACLVVWLGYALPGVTFFWWYLTVPLAGWVALAAGGLPRLARGPALYVSVALLTISLWTTTPRLYIGRAQSEYAAFAEVSNYLVEHARAGQKVMAEPIGMIGFQSPVVVVDEVGLVSPQVAERRRQGPGWYTDIAAQERPDWLVIRRGMVNDGRAFAGVGAPFRDAGEREAFLAAYEVSARMDTTAGDNELVVLRRRAEPR